MLYAQSTHLFLDAKKGLNENPQKLHRCFSQVIHFLVRIQNTRDLYWNLVKNFLVFSSNLPAAKKQMEMKQGNPVNVFFHPLNIYYLMVSTHLKNISQIASFPKK